MVKLIWTIARQNKVMWESQTENTERKRGRVRERDVSQQPEREARCYRIGKAMSHVTRYRQIGMG